MASQKCLTSVAESPAVDRDAEEGSICTKIHIFLPESVDVKTVSIPRKMYIFCAHRDTHTKSFLKKKKVGANSSFGLWCSVRTRPTQIETLATKKGRSERPHVGGLSQIQVEYMPMVLAWLWMRSANQCTGFPECRAWFAISWSGVVAESPVRSQHHEQVSRPHP